MSHMKSKTSKLSLSFKSLAIFCLFSGSALADQNYKPPKTPELYDTKEELVPLYKRVQRVQSHFYSGIGFGFGSSQRVNSSGTAKASWNLVAEGGYINALSSWSRVDLGVELFNGHVGNSKNNLDIRFGGLGKVGYGYNVSENLYAELRFGYGVATAKYTGDQQDENSITGTLWQVGAQLIVPTSSSIDVLGGVFFNQYAFPGRGIYDVYEGRMGLRYRF